MSCKRWGRGRAWGAAACLATVALLAGPAQAKDLNKLRAQVSELENLAQGLDVRFTTDAGGSEQIAEHRLVDAQVLYKLNDYTRAAILLFDYISKYKDTRGYPEALFYLADSLYKKRDFLSARRYFKIIVNDVKGQYYQDALQRLVELSLRVGDTSNITEYLNALASIPKDQLKPSVPYVWGKYHYFQGDLAQAQGGFAAIAKDHKYYLHAQYFLGAIQVRQKENATAVKTFQNILRQQPASKNEKHIQDLAHLALGRLLYEQGKINEAIDMYQKVPRRSPEFDTALYEISWAYIKAKEYQRALRALDLLVLAHPDSTFIPQVKVLQGNLLIRLEEWGRATDVFTSTREKFVPVQNRMQQIMTEHGDPNVFFDALLTRNVEEMGVVVQLPPLAISWVKEDPQVKRALDLVADLREIEESIKEAEALIDRLERAINTPARIKIFPEFAAAKAQALEVENRLMQARQEIHGRQLALIRKVAAVEEQAELEQLGVQRDELEQQVKQLPTSAVEYETRERVKVSALEGLEKDLTKLSIVVDSMRAQLVAAEKYYADTQEVKFKDKAVRESFKSEVAEVRTMIVGLQAELDDTRRDLEEAKAMTGVGGVDEVAERGVKERYREVLEREERLMSQLRSRLNGSSGGQFDTLSELRRRCQDVHGVLARFEGKLEAGVENRLSSIRAALGEERQQLGQYVAQSASFKAQTDTVAGRITYDGFQDVVRRFYEIIVRADVGIIDVSWALKDTKSKEVSSLVRQQKMDLKVLDEEFKEVLQEE